MMRSAKRRYYNKSFYENRQCPKKTWSSFNVLFGRNSKLTVGKIPHQNFGDLKTAVYNFIVHLSKTLLLIQPTKPGALKYVNSSFQSAFLSDITAGDLYCILFSFKPPKNTMHRQHTYARPPTQFSCTEKCSSIHG